MTDVYNSDKVSGITDMKTQLSSPPICIIIRHNDQHKFNFRASNWSVTREKDQ